MEGKNLPLTESVISSCEKSNCPWLENGYCVLAGELLRRMKNANLPTQKGQLMYGETKAPGEAWIEENKGKFGNFGEECVINKVNQTNLNEGRLTSPVILNANDPEQFEHNSDFVRNLVNIQLNSTAVDPKTSTIVVNRVSQYPGFKTF